MLNIAIIGTGNVATHLDLAFHDKCMVTVINPHTLSGMPDHPDFILISVKDDAIREIAEKLSFKDTIVAHTSGSVPMEALMGSSSHIGVFYPLQTFTKGVSLRYDDIPVFLEADSEETMASLERLARLFSSHILRADSEKRRALHLASVFACNFTNCLMGISRDILASSGIDFHVLLPLIRQTMQKLDVMTPREAQTGPAARRDKATMDRHMDMLASQPDLQSIYRDISEYIMNSETTDLK